MRKSKDKKNILILSTPAYGHINPILPIASELIKRGHFVSFYCTEEFRALIEKTGSKFVPYAGSKFEFIDSHAMKNAFMLADFIIDATWKILKNKPFSKEKPDIIIHDCLVLWGKVLAHKYSIPAVCFSVAMLINPKILLRYPNFDLSVIINSFLHMFRVQRRYKHLLKTFGVPFKGINDIFINEEKRTLVFTTELFQPDAQSFKDNFSFIGPSLHSQKTGKKISAFLKGKKRIVYISLGTITNNDINFFRICIEVFRDSEYTVIISLGSQISLHFIKDIPDNIFIRQYWSQLPILEKSELFITHGGMNSIMESAYYGVPMIVVPQRTEQRICALRLHELGAGIFIDKKKFTKEKLINAVSKIKNDKSYIKNIHVLKKSVHESGGYKKAVDDILFNSN